MATSNKQMSDMMRSRRADMAAMPADAPYSGPSSDEPKNDADKATEGSEKFTVAAPGDKGSETGFEYEPWLDTPGAWIVYPPGVPCDDTAYRIQMDKPAEADDFTEMQKALDSAGATSDAPASSEDSKSSSGDSGASVSDSGSY